MRLIAPASGPCPHLVSMSHGDAWECCRCSALFADRHEAAEAAFDWHVATALAVIA